MATVTLHVDPIHPRGDPPLVRTPDSADGRSLGPTGEPIEATCARAVTTLGESDRMLHARPVPGIHRAPGHEAALALLR